MKLIRLIAAAIVTAIMCLVYFYFVEPERLYETYRCLRYARPIYGCYYQMDLAFTTDFFGTVDEGNTRDIQDRNGLIYGAAEKPLLIFCGMFRGAEFSWTSVQTAGTIRSSCRATRERSTLSSLMRPCAGSSRKP